MILEVQDKEGPVLSGLWTAEWDVALPDATYTLPAPNPLQYPTLEDLLDSPAALLPSGSPALPPDWNLLTSLGLTLGIPYRFGLDVELMRIGKVLPFRLNFNHNTLDSFWSGQGFHTPGNGFSSRETKMNFDISQDPTRSWGLNLGLVEVSQGLQRLAQDYHSSESREAWITGEYRLPLAKDWFFLTQGRVQYDQKVLAGSIPTSATAGGGSFSPGILWILGDLGELTLEGSGEIWSFVSQIQSPWTIGSGDLSLGWKLYPGSGWALSGSLGAQFEEQSFLFPAQSKITWQNETWVWKIEGGFLHSRFKNLWIARIRSPLNIPLLPEASAHGQTSLNWKFSTLGSSEIKVQYQGGWLYENQGWNNLTGLENLTLEEGHRWTTEIKAHYLLFDLWKNELFWEARWGREVNSTYSTPDQKYSWNTVISPLESNWRLNHIISLSYTSGWEVPRGDLGFQLLPSPLVTIKAGVEDWTSLFMPRGRFETGSPYQEPGLRFYVSGQLNL